MARTSKADVIRRYYGAYESKDRKIVEELLTEDFTFTSPRDDAIDRVTYFRRCWPNSERITEIKPETIMEDADHAFVLYKLVIGGEQSRNTEYLTFAGDRIRAANVFFGATYKNGVFVQPQETN
jgi:ketosteroid isomerase-like protein